MTRIRPSQVEGPDDYLAHVPTSRTFLSRALRRSLGAIFLAAAVGKLLAIRHGQSNDLFQAIIGLSVAPRVGICAGEALLGIWLISGRWPELSAVVTLVLCSGFLGVLGSEIRKPAPRSCGCFGIIQRAGDSVDARASLVRSIALNIGMMLAAGSVLVLSRGSGRSKRTLNVVPIPSHAGVLAG